MLVKKRKVNSMNGALRPCSSSLRGLISHSLQDGSAEVELLQQPNNLNATVAERAVLTAIRRVSSAVSAAQNAVSNVRQNSLLHPMQRSRLISRARWKWHSPSKTDAPERVTVVEGLNARPG